MILHPVISEIASRRDRLAEAVRKGHLTPDLSRYAQPGWTYIYKDQNTPALAFARTGNLAEDMTLSGEGVLAYVVTTDDEDRDGDVVRPMGGQLHNYSRNPLVFFGHQEWEIPIGVCRSQDGRITVFPEENRMVDVIYFDLDDPDADFVYRKCKKKILNATSIAFVPIEAWRRDNVLKARTHDGGQGSQPGWYFNIWDKTEVSIVGVPSNPKAVGLEKDLNGACRDIYDRERVYMSPRLQKAWRPYCAVTKGCWNGWCPLPGEEKDIGGGVVLKAVTKAMSSQTFQGYWNRARSLSESDLDRIDSELTRTPQEDLEEAAAMVGVSSRSGDLASDLSEALRRRAQKSCSCADCQQGKACSCTKSAAQTWVDGKGGKLVIDQDGKVEHSDFPQAKVGQRWAEISQWVYANLDEASGKTQAPPGGGGRSRINYGKAPAATVSKPMGPYADFAACVRANQDKKDPNAYCATIMRQAEGKSMIKKDLTQADIDSPGVPGRNPNPEGRAEQEKGQIEYRTPFGTFGTWEEAAQRVEQADMDPTTVIEIIRKNLPQQERKVGESMQERDRMRKLQDKLLSLPAARKWIADHGENKPFWEGGPSGDELRRMLYFQWKGKIEQLIQDLGGKSLKALEQSDGRIGGYVVPSSKLQSNDAGGRDLDDPKPPGWDACGECAGTGNCKVCGGEGTMNSKDCEECGGNGDCGACAGEGHVEKSVKKRASSTESYDTQYGLRWQIPGGKSGSKWFSTDDERAAFAQKLEDKEGDDINFSYSDPQKPTKQNSAGRTTPGIAPQANDVVVSGAEVSQPTVPQVLAALYSHAKAEAAYIDQLNDTYKGTLSSYRDAMDKRVEQLKTMFADLSPNDDIDKMCKDFEDQADSKGMESTGPQDTMEPGEAGLVGQGQIPPDNPQPINKGRTMRKDTAPANGAYVEGDDDAADELSSGATPFNKGIAMFEKDAPELDAGDTSGGISSPGSGTPAPYNDPVPDGAAVFGSDSDAAIIIGDPDDAKDKIDDNVAAPFNKSARRKAAGDGAGIFGSDTDGAIVDGDPDDSKDKLTDTAGAPFNKDAPELDAGEAPFNKAAPSAGTGSTGTTGGTGQGGIIKNGVCMCGSEVPDGSDSCPGCGALVDKADDPTDPNAPDQQTVPFPAKADDGMGNDDQNPSSGPIASDPSAEEILERYRVPKSNKWATRKWLVKKQLLPYLKYRVAANGKKYFVQAKDDGSTSQPPKPIIDDDAIKSLTTKLAKAIDNLVALANAKDLPRQYSSGIKHVASEIWYVGKALTDKGKLQRNRGTAGDTGDGGWSSELDDRGKVQRNSNVDGDKPAGPNQELGGGGKGSLDSTGSQQGKSPAKSNGRKVSAAVAQKFEETMAKLNRFGVFNGDK